MKLTRMYHNKKTKKELTMLKKHLLILALVSSSVLGVYAMEEDRSNDIFVRAPDEKTYQMFQDTKNNKLVTLVSTGQIKTTLKAKISCGKKAKNYVNIHDNTIISLKIISSKKDPSKRRK